LEELNLEKTGKMSKDKWHIIFIIISFILFIISMRVMRFYSINVTKYIENEKILDLRMGYSYNDVNEYLAKLGKDGRNYYAKTFHLVDTFYPIIYSVFYLITLSYLIKKCFKNNKKQKSVLLLPIIGIICDYGENILIDSFIKTFENISQRDVIVSSYLTIIKFIFVYASLIIIILLTLGLIIKNIKIRGHFA
jgi:hypothetical protein